MTIQDQSIIIILLFLTIFVVILGIFIFSHIHPLTESEILQLAGKRRRKKISQYFKFSEIEYRVNMHFKKSMKPKGNFQNIDELLYEFPSIASALLKYKKHEWIIVAFEKNRKVRKIWINKGISRERVTNQLSPMHIVSIAKEENYISVLIFHNHPTRDIRHYTYNRPSNQDIYSANIYANKLSQEGINCLEFVCERGRYYKYYQSVADSFLRITELIPNIKLENNRSIIHNLSLHIERIF